jgi:T3SS (YopN, CesT) and YbjN peptide-binding chaperone 1
MEIAHEAHAETYRRVAEYLPEFFDDPFHDQENGHFYVRYGSTVLEVSVDPYGPKEAVVKIMSYCVQGATVEVELLKSLLELNHNLALGAFSVVGDDVFFSHSLFGRTLEARDLLGAIAAVADVADEYDDRIAAQYGGQTALERIQDTGGRKRRSGKKLQAEAE